MLVITAAAAAPGATSSSCRASSPGVSLFGNVLLAELPSGFELVGASHLRGSTLVTVLHAVTATCRPVASFGKNGTDVLTLRSSEYGAIDTLAAAPDGQLLLAGGDGKHALIGRLLANGALDLSFGVAGWARVHLPKIPLGSISGPAVTSIAVEPAGTIVVGGNDGNAHCCVRGFVATLNMRGAPVRSFDGGGSILLSKLQGSYTTDVLAGARGDVYVMGAVVFTGCGGPIVLRIQPDGSLDARFDRNVARTIAAETPHELLFGPAFVVRAKSGAFALLGDAGAYCVNAPGSTRVEFAIGVSPSGRVDKSFARGGRVTFRARHADEFDTDAIEMSRGRILLAEVTAGPRSVASPKLQLTVFSNSGAVDRSFGRSGSLTIDVSALGGETPPNIAVAQAPNNLAVVAVASTKAIDLIRLHV
jgi:hypothetical protein